MTRPGLDERDIRVLSHYAKNGNRELYWNYLAQLPGNDGYGKLALGVVRNDNIPGATANAYAAAYARNHDHKTLTERDWDNFGIDLMRRDFAYRKQLVDDGSHHEALNLPVWNVQKAHDKSFENIHVDPNAWTPRKLLEAARADGEAEAEKVWAQLLDNGAMGLHRGKDVLMRLASEHHMPSGEVTRYAIDMASAYATATDDRSHVPPDVVGTSDLYYERGADGRWVQIQQLPANPGMPATPWIHEVKRPAMLSELEDIHRLRLERQSAREAFAPDDPGKLVASSHPLADIRPTTSLPKPGDDPLYAAIRHQLPFDVTDDKVAEVALQARHIGIRKPSQMAGVSIHDERIVCEAIHSGLWTDVAVLTPAPAKDESLALAQQLDQHAIDARSQRTMAMLHEGPAMRL